jgi:hypothetical protein
MIVVKSDINSAFRSCHSYKFEEPGIGEVGDMGENGPTLVAPITGRFKSASPFVLSATHRMDESMKHGSRYLLASLLESLDGGPTGGDR